MTPFSPSLMLYLTVYRDPFGYIQSHCGDTPLAFVREVGLKRQAVLYRPIIDGSIIEGDTNDSGAL